MFEPGEQDIIVNYTKCHNEMKCVFSFLIMFLFLFSSLSYSQKPVIDSSVFGTWPFVRTPAISSDGAYASYFIQNQPKGSNTLVIQAIKSGKEVKVMGADNATFAGEGAYLFFKKRKDSLGIVLLNSFSVKYIPDVIDFQVPKGGTGEYLAYLKKESRDDKLFVYNFLTEKVDSVPCVTQFSFSDPGNALIYIATVYTGDRVKNVLHWLDMSTLLEKTIWEGDKVNNLLFDTNAKRLAFLGQSSTNEGGNLTEIMYYDSIRDTIVSFLHPTPLESDSMLDCQTLGLIGFSENSERLFFCIKEKESFKDKKSAAKVDVWSYTDAQLQSEQLNQLAPRDYTCVINIKDGTVIRLEQENDNIVSFIPLLKQKGQNVLIRNAKGDYLERNWNKQSSPSLYLVSTDNGTRQCLNKDVRWENYFNYQLSPGGKYIVYYDAIARDYFSFEIATGINRNITRNIPVNWTMRSEETTETNFANRAIEGWLEDDEAALIYDEFDIWKIDLSGTGRAAVNLTNGYGRRSKIIFRLGMRDYLTKLILNNECLILTAFSADSKQNGFYEKKINERGDPTLLTMDSCLYYYDEKYIGFSPIKATKSEAYILRRESAAESPNFIFTSRFHSFKQLSNIHPERTYNWFTSQLVRFKTTNGKSTQGILYKPENFDYKRKYPVIIEYYEQKSELLNLYQPPEFSSGDVEIPLFVSNDYLVFTPDIHYEIGNTGGSAEITVMSAYKYLSKLNYVDVKKIGIQGGSFGGYETNYILTHTKVFAAACSRSGFSNLISAYGSVMLSGGHPFFPHWAEVGQGRLEGVPWERPSIYIKNSPIFQVQKVATPLLMMNNKADGVVDFSLGVEFFMALRRAGKRVWMLQYDGQGHTLSGTAKNDYTIRLLQFFDHYLKGSPAPKWMIEGIPAKRKGIDDGLELEPLGITSGKSPLLK